MGEISDRDSLERWLKGRPIEDARLIAARAALRSLPLLATVLTEDPEQRRAAIILPSLRAMGVASLAGTWPRQSKEVRAAYAAAYVAHTAARAAHTAARAAAAAHAAAAAAHAADAAAAYAAHTAAAYAARAAYAAAYAALTAVRAAIWTAVSRDATALEGGTDHTALAHTPLWPGEKMPVGIARNWQSLRSHLVNSAKDEGWKPWVDWYEGILVGDPGHEDLERAKALILNEIWEQGPKP